MAKAANKSEIEFEPDAWERFERAVKVAAKSPPQHREKSKSKKRGGNKKKDTKWLPNCAKIKFLRMSFTSIPVGSKPTGNAIINSRLHASAILKR